MLPVTMATDERKRPLIFLAGPHGSGKTSLGGEACRRLGWTFVDLPPSAQLADLRRAIESHSANVIALPWELLQDPKVLKLARKYGELEALWAHPLEMQERSGRSEPVCTPVKQIKTRGGFGREGTRCREFRKLDRNCDGVLMLCGVSFEESVTALVEVFEDIAAETSGSPAERAGIASWVRMWQENHTIDKRAAEILVDAMGQYILHLEEQGRSPRSFSGLYLDFQAAGHLVFMYDVPKGEKVLFYFSGHAPWVGEFKRKFTDSPKLVERYERSLDGFAKFLEESGLRS